MLQSGVKSLKILCTGSSGFLGRQVIQYLEPTEACVFGANSKSGDLTDWGQARYMVSNAMPDVIIHTAAPLGGGNVEAASRLQADLMTDILLMGCNIFKAAKEFGVKRVVTIGSACAYPELGQVESVIGDLWNGLPHPSHVAYGIAKRTMQALGEAYRGQYGIEHCHIIPTSMFGEGDKIKGNNHFIPATIVKILEAQKKGEDFISLWGSGRPTRDLLYVRDAARLIVEIGLNQTGTHNIGTGVEVPISQVAEEIADLMAFKGNFIWDMNKPDGQERRSLYVAHATKGLTPRRVALENTIRDIRERVCT